MLNIKEPQQDNSLFLMEKRFEVILEISNKKLVKEVSELRESIGKLEDEIKLLRSSPKLPQIIQTNANLQSTNNPSEKKISNNSSSSQEINPADISIEKYFYFGKK